MIPNIKQETMSVDEWIDVPDCPIQRDTEAHARRAAKAHLKTLDRTHALVDAFCLPDGRVFKLDGHTRAFRWSSGDLERPEVLLVTIHKVASMEEGEALYKTFDNQAASENAGDRLSGAFHKQDFRPRSQLFKHGGITSAIRTLTGRSGKALDIYRDVQPWMGCIRVLDRQMFSNGKFPSGVLAAAMLTVRIYGESVIPIWEAVNNDEGVKTGKHRDGVQALNDLIAEKRAKKEIAGSAVNQELMSKAVSCVDRWRKGQTYTGGIKSTEMAAYIAEKLGDGYKDGKGSREQTA